MNEPHLVVRPGPFAYRVDGFSIPHAVRAELGNYVVTDLRGGTA